MRILHATTFLQGGAGRIITSLAIAQRRRGYDVRVVVDADDEPGYMTYPEYLDALGAAGVPVTRVRSTFKRNPELNRAAACTLKRMAADWRPDVIHAHAATPANVVRLAGLTGNGSTAPLIHTMHGWGIAKTPAQAAADIAALERADVVTTPSHAAFETLRAAGLRRTDVRVIPYGIADVSAEPPRARDVELIRASGATRVALCIGTLGERKNQRLLVEALAFERLADTAAVFIGDGDASPIVRRAHELGVSDRAIILGHRPRASRYLPLAETLVLPSRNEGLPIVVLEALSVGIPVVATRLPEIAEAVGPDLAQFLVEPDDREGLAQAIFEACRVPCLMGLHQRLRRRFVERHAESSMVTAYITLCSRSARHQLD